MALGVAGKEQALVHSDEAPHGAAEMVGALLGAGGLSGQEVAVADVAQGVLLLDSTVGLVAVANGAVGPPDKALVPAAAAE